MEFPVVEELIDLSVRLSLALSAVMKLIVMPPGPGDLPIFGAMVIVVTYLSLLS